MYQCEECNKVSPRYETQFRIITKVRSLIKGFEIEEEKKVCKECYEKFNKTI